MPPESASSAPAPVRRPFRCSSDYLVTDRNPLELRAGDQVRVGRPDSGWPGWIWVTAADGRGSHVPEELLDPEDRASGMARVRRDFHARDLSVRKDEAVDSLREVRGWHWCRNGSGEEGWLPAYLLREE